MNYNELKLRRDAGAMDYEIIDDHVHLGWQEVNTADQLIANFEPAATCKANHIELHVAPDGSAYTVRIPAKGHERTFKSK